MYYQICNCPSYDEVKKGLKHSLGCIADGDARHEVIYKAEQYFCEKALDEGEYGDGELDVLLVITDDNDEEFIEPITLTWFADDEFVQMKRELSSPFLTGRI